MIVDYYDANGIKRRVKIPSEEARPEEGIPLSVDADKLYEDVPVGFRQRIVQELWNVGLIEPKDFLQSDVKTRIRAALLAAIKYDTIDILTYALQALGE